MTLSEHAVSVPAERACGKRLFRPRLNGDGVAINTSPNYFGPKQWSEVTSTSGIASFRSFTAISIHRAFTFRHRLPTAHGQPG
jgi:hypothetical protein